QLPSFPTRRSSDLADEFGRLATGIGNGDMVGKGVFILVRLGLGHQVLGFYADADFCTHLCWSNSLLRVTNWEMVSTSGRRDRSMLNTLRSQSPGSCLRVLRRVFRRC